jgi:hypothetical protein
MTPGHFCKGKSMMIQKKNNRFGRGGCFTCKRCGKRTRDTGENASVQMCPLCDNICLYENSLSDNGWGKHGDLEECKTVAEVHAKFTELKGRAENK